MLPRSTTNSYAPDDWLLEHLRGFTPEYHLPIWRRDGRELDEWRSGLVAALRSAIGLDRVQPVERNLRVLDRYEEDGLTIERILFDSDTGVTVPGLVLLPRQASLPRPAVVVSADVGESKFAAMLPRWTMPGDVSRSLVRRLVADEFIVVVPDPIGGGERQANELGQALAGAWLGKPLLGRSVADLVAAVDALDPRQEVQSDRVSVVGMGSGGAAALFAMALDRRFRVGVVGGQLATFGDRVRHLIKTGWTGSETQLAAMCPGVLALAELSDVAALCAPQPLMMLHGEDDPACPVDSAREAAQEIRDAFDALGGKGLFRADFLAEIGSRAYEDIREFLKLHLYAQYV